MIKKAHSDPPECSNEIMAIQDTLEILGGKWKLLIIHYLMTREAEVITFKKMEKDIDGISAKMLSKELKTLEMNRLINRTVLPTKPVSVQYQITEYGKKTQELIKQLVSWGSEHRLQIFDTKNLE